VLTATTLPEGQSYPPLYSALEGLLDAIEAAPSAVGWGAALVRYELLLLAEMGFGLDLERCAVTGSNDNLVAVSPKSGRAVSAAEFASWLTPDLNSELISPLARSGPARLALRGYWRLVRLLLPR